MPTYLQSPSIFMAEYISKLHFHTYFSFEGENVKMMLF